MSTDVFYFSGTGNSLATARDIAERIHGTAIPIPSVIDKERVETEADGIGIIFPCYLGLAYGIPLIVERFVRKIENIGSKYVFAVCTHGGLESGNALPTLKRLSRLVGSMGGVLAGEFSIHLPMNNLEYPSRLVEQNQETMFEDAKGRIELICRKVAGRERSRYGIPQSLFNALMGPTYLAVKRYCVAFLAGMAKEPKYTKLKYHELIPLTDKSIVLDDNCNGCGMCAKVCPVKNIAMIDGRPTWRHHCEMCFACDEWCPRKAIYHWSRKNGVEYHHPAVKLADMLRQRG